MHIVLLKKVPQCCDDCPCVYVSPYNQGYCECRANYKRLDLEKITTSRADFCPLKELPPFNDYKGIDILMNGIAIGWNELLSQITGIKR